MTLSFIETGGERERERERETKDRRGETSIAPLHSPTDSLHYCLRVRGVQYNVLHGHSSKEMLNSGSGSVDAAEDTLQKYLEETT